MNVVELSHQITLFYQIFDVYVICIHLDTKQTKTITNFRKLLSFTRNKTQNSNRVM